MMQSYICTTDEYRQPEGNTVYFIVHM